MTYAVSEKIYNEELLPWLPDEIVDCHVHVWLEEHTTPMSPERRKEIWAMEVAKENTFEDLKAINNLLFPKQKVKCLVFGLVFHEIDI
ncbi:MAG: hypothetical protein SNJ70_08170, partial [Armatimonadota bacterium]